MNKIVREFIKLKLEEIGTFIIASILLCIIIFVAIFLPLILLGLEGVWMIFGYIIIIIDALLIIWGLISVIKDWIKSNWEQAKINVKEQENAK